MIALVIRRFRVLLTVDLHKVKEGFSVFPCHVSPSHVDRLVEFSFSGGDSVLQIAFWEI